ncbi:uncharacterized protein LOC129919029 [Episyrphus balteatus]|uniref:uncharacterized protein LOC129919029 n=1 Tax=Episyrphus balteatus TaxID=286459 RepID=UPI0024851695|nr:uncharacterized protein LOC129919029 [Episyrphus balteatus]
MRLFESILQNISPQKIARNVVTTFTNPHDSNITSITAKNILHSMMDAIGFNYYVTMNEIQTNYFEWPEQESMSYRFKYDKSIFDRYLDFLKDFIKEMNQSDLLNEIITIIDIFLNFFNAIDEQLGDRFFEPFSLISFSLLQAMHRIRKRLNEPILVLDTICHKLFQNSEKGLGYPDSHQTIFKGICVLLGRDYNYFSFFDKNIFNFYCKCMEYEYSTTSGALFIYMHNALEKSTSERTNLVNFLTDEKLIKAYCVFAQQNGKNQVFALLKFLNSLLDHLPVLECFSREQVHIIFSNALRDSKKNRDQAVKFYLTYMRKSFTNKFILRDIIDFLVIKANGTDILDCFIYTLWDEFPYITELDPYLKILQKVDWDVKILSVAAQVAIRVYQKLYQEYDSNDDYPLRLSKFLLKIPSLMMLLKGKWQIRGILLNIYSIIDFEKANFTIKDFPIAADRYIKYAQRYLKKDGEDYSIVQNTVHIMLQLMDHLNMQDEIEDFAKSVYLKYNQLVSQLDELTESQIMSLQNTLIMLSNLADTPLALEEENLLDLLSSLKTHLIESNKFQELSDTFNCFLGTLAITTYSGCINDISMLCSQITPEDTSTASTILMNHVNPFLKYLLDYLENSNLSNARIFYNEAAIRALCDLYIVFNFKLERQVYYILVNCVNFHVFEAPMESSDRLRQLELRKNILKSFNLMHKSVEIPVAITWKIILHFGMTQHFEKELTELMDILFEYNSARFKKPSLFAYIVPVAIFNLFQSHVPIPKFQKALRAHKSYVEEKQFSDGSNRIMKVHIILTMVDMIEKTIKTGEINKQTNRMHLLSNLSVLLTDVYQTESDLILSQTRRLETHSLTPAELRTLSSFQDQLT